LESALLQTNRVTLAMSLITMMNEQLLYLGDFLMVMFLKVASGLDEVLVLVPAVAAVLLVDISLFIISNSRLVRTCCNGWRWVGLWRLGDGRLRRLVSCNTYIYLLTYLLMYIDKLSYLVHVVMCV